VYVAGGSVTLTNDTFSGNSALGGNGAGGGSRADNSGGYGGGGGNASGGGVYMAGGAATLTNDTLSGNSALGGAGGPNVADGTGGTGGNGGNGGNASGGGLSIVRGTMTLTNTLIAQNMLTAGTRGLPFGFPGIASGPDVSGSVSSSDHDLVGDGTGSNLSNGVNGNQVGTPASPISPLIGPLQDNGGPTQTMALLPGSPALDAGDSTALGLPATDQRGPGFPRVVNGQMDIGAYQTQPLSITTSLPGGTYGTAYSQMLTATGGFGGPYTFAVTPGSLPAGLSLDGTAGTLSGTPTAAGAFTFTVTATDSAGFSASQSYTLTIDKAALTITANNASRIAGEANPTFSVSYSGLVLGEGSGVLSGTLTFSTPATAGSPPGLYAITPAGLTSANYAITFVSGTLTVISYGQAIGYLQAKVDAAGLANGMQSSLDSQLQAAIAYFAAGDTSDGVSQLQSFISHVSAQSGKQIAVGLANAWVADAREIINAVP
jgi:hypothetical protein